MNSIQDGLVLLASAQHSAKDAVERLKQWDDTQLEIEQSAYEAMNASDKVLNLSREGAQIVSKLIVCCDVLMNNPDEEACANTKEILEELVVALGHISQASTTINEVAHTIEKNVAEQKVIEEGISDTMHHLTDHLDEVVAGTELYLTLKDFIFE